MKLIAILTTLIGGLASVQAQHHAPAPATFNANINGGINSPTNGNIDIEGVATIIDKANDNTERKLHDMLTSVKDVIEEELGLDLIDALALGGNGTRRLSSKTNKSGKAIIDGVDELLLALAVIVLLLVQFLGLGGGGTTTTSTQAATTSATTTASTTSATTSATTTGTTCPIVPIPQPDSVANNLPCCEDADCVPGSGTNPISKYIVPLVSNVSFSLSILSIYHINSPPPIRRLPN